MKRPTKHEILYAAAKYIVKRTRERVQSGDITIDPSVVAKLRFRNRADAMAAIVQVSGVQSENDVAQAEHIIELGLAGNA